MDLKRIVEKMHFRFGISISEIGKHLNLHEKSIRKLMDMNMTKESIGK